MPLCPSCPLSSKGLRPAQAHENRFFDLVVLILVLAISDSRADIDSRLEVLLSLVSPRAKRPMAKGQAL